MSKGKTLSEEEALFGLRTNDSAVMSRLYKLHYPMILNFVVSNSGTELEAKDIYQEAFIILYESLNDSSFKLNCQIKTYLYSVCRRLWLKRLYYKNRFEGRLTDFEPYIALPEAETKTADEQELMFGQMEKALVKLGEPCRTILEDFYIHGLNMQQIAQKMGYTNAENAKNQKYKCLNRLRKIAESLMPSDD
ncbi:RNA polymerase sigma factor, sigma-70 family [Flexibacter flexilis DSM 6793]|uniref:RNA polymerase sigma factor, sigma-70 family n=1 Tax=Flexibacter flexilis DSM 6793 TaxID=927664 RepID=A0A1I1GRV6_9BACT|nr:sigma-70 family RNA polymerase sigma factor [Flexibacter flexilis]SFC14216.1 RNA polymerase sigma factor, sigma-70 family [Flexibacter flexilis DSM 6793]